MSCKNTFEHKKIIRCRIFSAVMCAKKELLVFKHLKYTKKSRKLLRVIFLVSSECGFVNSEVQTQNQWRKNQVQYSDSATNYGKSILNYYIIRGQLIQRLHPLSNSSRLRLHNVNNYNRRKSIHKVNRTILLEDSYHFDWIL